MAWTDNLVSKLKTERLWLRIFLAELLGTFFLVLVGDGSVAQMKISSSESYLTVILGYGLAVAFAVYICGSVSGGHVNPAITLSFAVVGNVTWCLVPVYFLAQYLGAFLGATGVYAVYADGFNQVLNNTSALVNGGVFATMPAPYFSIAGGLADQVVGTAILASCVLAITDKRNANVPQGLVPLLVGLVVAMIGMSFGINCGFAINPARDLAPRILAAIIFNEEVFSVEGYRYFWIPIIGPHIGAIVGMLVYKLFVSIHWPSQVILEEEEEVQLTSSKP